MPQIRAVMSGASSNERPRRSASKKRGGSKILSFGVHDLAVADADVERALALDAGEHVRLDRARLVSAHADRLRVRNGSASALNDRKTRTSWSSVAPSRFHQSLRLPVFGVSIGP